MRYYIDREDNKIKRCEDIEYSKNALNNVFFNEATDCLEYYNTLQNTKYRYLGLPRLNEDVPYYDYLVEEIECIKRFLNQFLDTFKECTGEEFYTNDYIVRRTQIQKDIECLKNTLKCFKCVCGKNIQSIFIDNHKDTKLNNTTLIARILDKKLLPSEYDTKEIKDTIEYYNAIKEEYDRQILLKQNDLYINEESIEYPKDIKNIISSIFTMQKELRYRERELYRYRTHITRNVGTTRVMRLKDLKDHDMTYIKELDCYNVCIADKWHSRCEIIVGMYIENGLVYLLSEYGYLATNTDYTCITDNVGEPIESIQGLTFFDKDEREMFSYRYLHTKKKHRLGFSKRLDEIFYDGVDRSYDKL